MVNGSTSVLNERKDLLLILHDKVHRVEKFSGLKEHFEFVYQHKSVFDEEAIMADLPLHTRSKIVRSMYKDMIDNSMFFDGGEQYNETAVIKISTET